MSSETTDSTLVTATIINSSMGDPPDTLLSSANTRKRGLDEEEPNDDNDDSCVSVSDSKITKTDCDDGESLSDYTDLDEVVEEPSLENQVFSNHLVRRKIFKFCSFQDLKFCRQVNRLWNLEATKLLRKNFEMKVVMLTEESATVKGKYEVNNPTTMDIFEFWELTEDSTLFPCTSFGIEKGPLSHHDAEYKFLVRYGSIVKSLLLQASQEGDDYYDKDEEFYMLGMLFFSAIHLPNLEVLICRGEFTEPESDAEDEDIIRHLDLLPDHYHYHNFKLEKLKTVYFYHEISKYCLEKICEMATHLQEIYWTETRDADDYFDGLEILSEMNKIHMLQNIYLVFMYISMDFFEHILKQKPAFKILKQVHFDDEAITKYELRRMGNFFTTLYQQCSKTLANISKMEPLGHIPELIIPSMPNVVRLAVNYTKLPVHLDSDPIFVPIFPPGLNLANTFPSLKTFKFEFHKLEGAEVIELFENSKTPLLTVRNLKIICRKNSRLPKVWMKQLCELFPNVTKAIFSAVFGSDGGLDLIWTLRWLEVLEIQVPSDFKTESFLQLESDLTGLSQETVMDLCEKLKISPESFDLSEEEVKVLRIKPSMVDLKQLRLISIEFVPMINNELNYPYSESEYPAVKLEMGQEKCLLQGNGVILLSHVARKFCFQMCPLLNSRVNISYGLKDFTLIFTDSK